MQKTSAHHSSDALFRRVFEMWPYLLIAISVGGFAYIALNNAN